MLKVVDILQYPPSLGRLTYVEEFRGLGSFWGLTPKAVNRDTPRRSWTLICRGRTLTWRGGPKPNPIVLRDPRALWSVWAPNQNCQLSAQVASGGAKALAGRRAEGLEN